MRDSLKAWLEDDGFTALTAASGEEALSILSNQKIRLVLTDIKMPGMDGVELLHKALEIQPELQVVMMTAYATVETAVEAMKTGARDYLVKPFEPEDALKQVNQVYRESAAALDLHRNVQAVVLAGASRYYDPATGKNPFGYGRMKNVVTMLEFERMLSGTGPDADSLLWAQTDRRPLRIAWLSCVGSRDLQSMAPFCSTTCCMISVKQMVLAKQALGPDLDTVYFHMDLRSFGKEFQRYVDKARSRHGVRLVRGRVHSLFPHTENDQLLIRWSDETGKVETGIFDMAVLAVGQRPPDGLEDLAEKLGVELDSWGFLKTQPHFPTRASRAGIFATGGMTGNKDISDSILLASASACEASAFIHSNGGGLGPVESEIEPLDIGASIPSILVILCACKSRHPDLPEFKRLEARLSKMPEVSAVEILDKACGPDGAQALASLWRAHQPNRVLLAACHPLVHAGDVKEAARQTGLSPEFWDVVDLFSLLQKDEISKDAPLDLILDREISVAMARLKNMELAQGPGIPVTQRVLVVGGGPAGMAAALTVGDHGMETVLVEASHRLGGNLNRLVKDLDNNRFEDLAADLMEQVGKHPKIKVFTGHRVSGFSGRLGRFSARIKDQEGAETVIEHGAVILATGCQEADLESYAPSAPEGVITQMAFEDRMKQGMDKENAPDSVVMILCAGSRTEPRNYCSRVCCPTALKQAVFLKEQNPDTSVFVLYRDMMTCGFDETAYQTARQNGVVFMRYNPENPPEIKSEEGRTLVFSRDHVLDRPVKIQADLVICATGMVPHPMGDLAKTIGVGLDTDGFYKEADSKWRPVDGDKNGVFVCGAGLGPKNAAQSMASGKAAAIRALAVVHQKEMPAPNAVAVVRHGICAKCRICIEVCPADARSVDEETMEIVVDDAACLGCGACAAACPNGAAFLPAAGRGQILDMIGESLF